MAKTENKIIERTYNVPLRKEYRKVPRWRKTKKAVTALRQFLSKHMKSDDIKLSNALNEKVWQHGIKNPPHHIKVTVTKDEKGVVNADLFGADKKTAKNK
jgi:large subunit ribosomal protein L31e